MSPPAGEPGSPSPGEESAGEVGVVAAWWPVAAWGVAILVATSIPDPGTLGTGGWPVDKVVHGVMYFGLGATIVRALRLSGRWTVGTLLLAVLAAAAFAGLDEWHQQWVGRDPELADWIADAVGLTLGVAALSIGFRRRERGMRERVATGDDSRESEDRAR